MTPRRPFAGPAPGDQATKPFGGPGPAAAGSRPVAPRLLERLVHRWEHRLHARSTDRVVRPFEWGLDWLGVGDVAELGAYADRAVECSEAFFQYAPVGDYHFDGECVRFSSPVSTPYAENNTVQGRYFPAREARGRAVVVLPHWNAQGHEHVGLARVLARCGVSAVRLSLPYHDVRMPAGLGRADYAVSSNVGRTLHANWQAILDVRATLDWLETRGYSRLGLVGTSLGSCIAFIVAAHDRRIRASVFNHVSTWFADVVWRGISTDHVRTGLEGSITLEDLRRYWAPISPASYAARVSALRGESSPSLRAPSLRAQFLWARYDLSFPPDLSQQAMELCRRSGMAVEDLGLPCGHYTSGKAPFKWIVGAKMARFLTRAL